MKLDDYREQEKDWASRLHGLSLVSEAGFDHEVSLDAFRFVFRSYQRQSFFREDRIHLLRRYPASLLAGLTSIASSEYEEGTFWPKVDAAVCAKTTQIHRMDLSDSFRYGLEYFHLSRFDTPLRNVGEILMHAGIPVHSADDFLKLLSDRSSKRPDLTGEDFCGWAGGMDRATAAAKGLDAPTWRFLKEGGEFAVDLTDRFLTFLDAATTRQPELVEEALQAIPMTLADIASEFYRSGSVRSSQRATGSRRRSLIPQIVYADGQVQVRLPVFDSTLDNDSSWTFSVPGQSWTRTIRSSWTEQPQMTILEPLSCPVTEIVVSNQQSMLEWKLGVINAAMPLLAFDQDNGKLIPPANQLPASWVWLAFPVDDSSLLEDTLDVEGNLNIIERADPPYGWKGWGFVKADLSSVKKLRIKGKEDRWRFVSRVKRPALVVQAPVPFIHSSNGSPVYSTRPTLVLPPVLEQWNNQANLKWRVQLVDAVGGGIISSQTIEAGQSEVEVDPWEDLPFGIIGEFEVQAARALGQSARFEIAVAEGLAVEPTPRFRYLDSRGTLEPALVDITFDNSIKEIRIGPSDVSTEFTVASNELNLVLRSIVDHMWLSLEEDGLQSRRATTPLPLEIESLGNAILRLAVPPDQRGCLTLVCERNTVSRDDTTGDSNGVVRIPLSRLHDTARRYGGGDLYYESSGNVSLIARIRPRKLASAVAVQAECVVVTRLYENLDLQIQLRLDNAPWLRIEPLRLPPNESAAQLPAIVDGRGPLTVTLQPFDPWNFGVASSQQKHARENEFRIAAEIDRTRETLEDRFIRWVAGIDSIPQCEGAISFALKVYDTIRLGRANSEANVLLREVADLTYGVGAGFFAIVSSSQWSQQTHTRLLAEGWPATAPTASHPVDQTTWRRSPYIGLLESLRNIEENETQSQLTTLLGDEGIRVLREGDDPAIKVGWFGHSNVAELAEKPKELQDLIWKSYSPVPGPILTADQRFVHARELFDHRSNPRLKDLIGASPTIVEEAHMLLVDRIGPHATRPVTERQAPRNWRQLPQVSLAIAFAARLAARTDIGARDLYDYARHWYADLADCAPAFVEQDLILAELWLAHWERR